MVKIAEIWRFEKNDKKYEETRKQNKTKYIFNLGALTEWKHMYKKAKHWTPKILNLLLSVTW